MERYGSSRARRAACPNCGWTAPASMPEFLVDHARADHRAFMCPGRPVSAAVLGRDVS